MRPVQPPRLRDIALLLGGGFIVGLSLGVIAIALARFFTHSNFVAGIIFGTALYGSWAVGYQRAAIAPSSPTPTAGSTGAVRW
jgi:hypothetical protein